MLCFQPALICEFYAFSLSLRFAQWPPELRGAVSTGSAGLGAAEEWFGEFAAAGTTQSSVVSVLRAQHRAHSSPRISL